MAPNLIAPTEFDKDGNESAYSRYLCVKVYANSATECISFKSAANGADSGDGGYLITSAEDQIGFSKMIGLIMLIVLIGWKGPQVVGG